MVTAQPVGGEDPIVLFAKMMPVFSHSRCENCHGAVNPFNGDTHEGGVIRAGFDWTTGDMGMRNTACLASGCHSVAPDWRLAPHHLDFVGKDTKQLCKLQAEQVKRRSGDGYLSHLNGDILIDLAFEGYSGGASTVPAPPDMSKTKFLAAAKAWINEGGALCGGWTGTITQKETFQTRYTHPIPVGKGPSTTTVVENATRTMTITLGNGEATSQSEMSGHQTLVMVMRDVGPNGPCSTTSTSNLDWKGVGTNAGDAHVHVNIAPDGTYTILFMGPVETTKTESDQTSTGNCGPNPTIPADPPIVIEWPAKTFFTVRGRLPDPRVRKHLKDIITSDGSNPRYPKTWLDRSPAGNARDDTGARIPIAVTVNWDLTLEE
jgi:hypothetical protein